MKFVSVLCAEVSCGGLSNSLTLELLFVKIGCFYFGKTMLHGAQWQDGSRASSKIERRAIAAKRRLHKLALAAERAASLNAEQDLLKYCKKFHNLLTPDFCFSLVCRIFCAYVFFCLCVCVFVCAL